MFNFNSIVILFVGSSLLFGTIHQQESKKRTITRVRKPDLPAKPDIYFDDLFAEALVGDRPQPEKINQNASANPNGIASNSESITSARWSQHISREAIEDEIKRINQQLGRSITSPSGFNSQAQTARQHFSQLSMLFAIIGQYDKEVRWKKFARSAQVNFADAANAARTPSRQSFAVAKSRQQDLNALVRGAGIPTDEHSEKIRWPTVADRGPLMERLETALRDNIKPAAAGSEAFNRDKNKLLLEANIIAAISQVLIQEEMDDADDDGYVEYSNSMGSAARILKNAIEGNDFDAAAAAINKLEQSCNRCHAEWR